MIKAQALCRRTRGDNPSQNRAVWCAQERCEEDLTFSSVTFPSPIVGERHIILRSTSLDLSAFFPLFHNPPQPPRLPVRIHLPVRWATLTCTDRHCCADFTIPPSAPTVQVKPLLRSRPRAFREKVWVVKTENARPIAPRRSSPQFSPVPGGVGFSSDHPSCAEKRKGRGLACDVGGPELTRVGFWAASTGSRTGFRNLLWGRRKALSGEGEGGVEHDDTSETAVDA